MRRVRAIALVAVLVGFLGLWAAFAQSSPSIAAVDKVGWWTRRVGAMPEGNPTTFEVAAGVQGDESIAALRVLVRGEITKATLVLPEANAPLSSVTSGKLRVCTTADPWLVTDGGAYTAAPKPDCSAAVELKRTADVNGVGTWAGDVTSMLSGARSEVTLMVVPSPDTSAVVPPTYYMALQARVDADGTPDAPPPTSPSISPSAPAANITPSGPRVTIPSGTTAAPVATTPTTVAATTPTSTPRRFVLASTPKDKKPWGKLFLLVPLAAIGAALYTGGRKFWAERLVEATT